MTTNDPIQYLQHQFTECHIKRPIRTVRYEAATELLYSIEMVESSLQAQAALHIERFIGGGYAGQVYRVRLKSLTVNNQPVQTCEGLTVGNLYAVKVLIPPLAMGLLFRNLLYAVGFQGPFQLQVNPAAAKAGALWQKFIRHAAAAHFGDDNAVKNVYATFVDATLGSCGEISDWVEGRTWRLEVDDHMDVLKLWRKGSIEQDSRLGSPEYRAKYRYMHEFVGLLHQIGAHEFARQYEWTTCKSQPNALKRLDTGNDPAAGLIAIDFRAGLTLLPFLPMSPGDFKLIWQGLKRGSLVQFDRGSIEKLELYLKMHPQVFNSMPHRDTMLQELKRCETLYRNSVPDITHNHLRLLYDGQLWSTIRHSRIQGWKVQNIIDEGTATSLTAGTFKYVVFLLLGLIPLLGGLIRKCWGRPEYRDHYAALLTNIPYFLRAVRAHIIEKMIGWIRSGRVSPTRGLWIADNPAWYFLHLPVSILPAGLHRILTDRQVFREKMHLLFVRPFKLYFNAELRSQWLKDMVLAGQKKHILNEEDARTILSQTHEPFIQKYLVSLVVHLMTLPVTQVVSGTIAAIYYFTHPEVPQAERAAVVTGILVLFQIIPMSPGSLCRGFYTTYMAMKDRDFKNYNIALFLSYFKYIGYLAFPIQMTYHYPAIARFMASHWATDVVHIVPVFGERGALLERWVFGLCYNWPLTIRRRMNTIAHMRTQQKKRLIHLPLVILLVGGLLAAVHQIYHLKTGHIPSRENFWFLKTGWPFAGALLCGWLTTAMAGGMPLVKRILSGAVCGILTALVYSIAAVYLETTWQLTQPVQLFFPVVWRCFAFAIFATIAVLIREMSIQDPKIRTSEF